VTRIRIIDAFTDRPFSGNPAAVCLLGGGQWPDERWMRQVAMEMSLSETAFAHPLRDDAGADWALRWFTPVVEDDLCGHATLAAAHALREDGHLTGNVRFMTRSGVLRADACPDGAITLDFPAATVAGTAVPAGLADALGAAPAAAMSTGQLRDVLAVFGTEGEVRALAPDMDTLAVITRRDGIRGVTATAPAAEDSGSGYDFVSRFFSPADGIGEDPVTGSAHTALSPYWAGRLGRREVTGFQASARGGFVRTQLDGNRVRLSGHARTVLDGRLLHSPLA
jgi:PhzF family phenazine biosynthesis protein